MPSGAAADLKITTRICLKMGSKPFFKCLQVFFEQLSQFRGNTFCLDLSTLLTDAQCMAQVGTNFYSRQLIENIF